MGCMTSGSNRDAEDPDVGANARLIGTAFPGTFILVRTGRVQSRFFQDFFIERNAVSRIMTPRRVRVLGLAQLLRHHSVRSVGRACRDAASAFAAGPRAYRRRGGIMWRSAGVEVAAGLRSTGLLIAGAATVLLLRRSLSEHSGFFARCSKCAIPLTDHRWARIGMAHSTHRVARVPISSASSMEMTFQPARCGTSQVVIFGAFPIGVVP